MIISGVLLKVVFILYYIFICTPFRISERKKMQSAMQEVFLRFPHLSENIFGQLNSEYLGKSKEVCRSWYDYLDGQKFFKNRADKVK